MLFYLIQYKKVLEEIMSDILCLYDGKFNPFRVVQQHPLVDYGSEQGKQFVDEEMFYLKVDLGNKFNKLNKRDIEQWDVGNLVAALKKTCWFSLVVGFSDMLFLSRRRGGFQILVRQNGVVILKQKSNCLKRTKNSRASV